MMDKDLYAKITVETNIENDSISSSMEGCAMSLCIMAGIIINDILQKFDTPEEKRKALRIMECAANRANAEAGVDLSRTVKS